MAVVVSDTSPIRALAHLGHLDLLQELFSEILIPPAVEWELRHPPKTMTAVYVERLPYVRIESPHDRGRVDELLRELDPGESEALALAIEIKAAAVLIDETAGRACAFRFGLPVIGTLGILLRSKEKGLIDAIRPLLDQLQEDLGFFISSEVREQVLRRAFE